MIKIIALILFSLSAADLFACGVSTPSYVNLAISTAEEAIFTYGIKDIDEKLPTAMITNCRETAVKRRFVMITFGPSIVNSDDSIRGTNFDKEFPEPSGCLITNNPFKKIQSHEESKSDFTSKWKFINECVEVQVTELGPRPLSYPADQIGCKVTSVTPKSSVFSGGFCFFKPYPDSELSVSVSVKESCKKLKSYKDLGIDLIDFEAGMSYYTSSTYKDEINDLSSFGASSFRLSVNPLASLFKPSDDFGILRPTFPGDYPVNDIHIGKIELYDQGSEVAIKTPFIVDNACKFIQKDGLKSSICNYALPVVGEIKLINSKNQVEATWFDGGIASSRWQGILNGEGARISKELLRANEVYKLEVNFADPHYEYNAFKKRIRSKFALLHVGMPVFTGTGGISEIPDINIIADISPIIEVGTIGDVKFPASIDGLDGSRKRLGSYFSTSLFPPMYEKVCRPDTGVCKSVGKSFVKLTATFKVNNDYSIADLEVERSSELLGSYKKKVTEQSEYICN